MVTLEEYEKLNPRTELKFGDVSVCYVTPNTFTKWRVVSLFEKEPITIEGIGGFSPEDVLFDVGANVGIDVDGFEPKIIAGARRIIGGGKLRSLLIEVNQNLADHMQMVGELNALGFIHDPAQVAAAERKSGAFKGCAEYVFKR